MARRPRGLIAQRLDLLERLQPLLRAPVEPERMLRSVARLLAADSRQYCIVDFIGREGVLSRLEIAHADASLRARLRVVCDGTLLLPNGRVPRLLGRGDSEVVPDVGDALRARALADIVLDTDDPVRSYMATTVAADGEPVAVVTLVTTRGGKRYSADDLATLESIVGWVGLGLENAIRRELQPRTSVVPPIVKSTARRA